LRALRHQQLVDLVGCRANLVLVHGHRVGTYDELVVPSN